MTQDIAIKVENISKVYKLYNHNRDRLKESLHLGGKKYHHEHYALHNINFEIKKGETVGIIGKNGSGKSTLLKIITGVLTPTTGQVTVKGKISALLELGAGFNPAYTGMENVYLQCQLMGYTNEEIEEKLPHILQFADIGEFVHQPVKTYSSGMFVRLAFAIQACVEPEIFIVDEALAVGDIFFRQKCYQYFDYLRSKGTSILLVTHGMMDIEQFCQKALLLNKGNAVFIGKAGEAVKHYYLLERQSLETTFQPSLCSTDTIEPNSSSALTNLFWPKLEAFLDLSAIPQIGNGWARCTGIAICDEKGNPCASFKQGENCHFFYEFEFLHDIEVPIAGISIRNHQGLVVHGKNTLQYNTMVPSRVKKGSILRFQHQIQLNLAWGEYTFTLGIATISDDSYQKRLYYSHEQLTGNTLHLAHLTDVSHFQIESQLPNEHTSLLHHGVADLPGNIKFTYSTND